MITKKNQVKIAFLTKEIKISWRKNVESLIDVGRCLHELKTLLDRPSYLEHLNKHFSMSEMCAHRIEHLYLKFHDKKSIQVLSSKPSVLYLLASNIETKKIESLANGGKLLVGNKYKTLSQFTINDVYLLQGAGKAIKAKSNEDREDDNYDKARLKNADREFSTILEAVNDFSLNLDRFISEGQEIKNSHLISRYIEETIECLIKLKEKLK